MEYLVAILTAAGGAGIAYATVNKEITDKIPFLKSGEAEAYPSAVLGIIHRLTLILVAALLCGVAGWKIVDSVSDGLGIARMLILVLAMAGAACVDYRERRIPNFFPGILALSAIVLLGLGLVLQKDGAIAYITTNFLSAVCCAVFLFLAAALSKQGIGAGDIKLVAALAMIGGVYAVIGTLLFGVTLCCVGAVICLVTKKKNLSGSLPFGPFLFVGLIVSVLLGCF